MPRPHVTSRRWRGLRTGRCFGPLVRLTSRSGRVEVSLCECCGEVRVFVDGGYVFARPGPLTVDGFRAACHAASHLVEGGDADAAAELIDLGS
jgi:hypothetical protein